MKSQMNAFRCVLPFILFVWFMPGSLFAQTVPLAGTAAEIKRDITIIKKYIYKDYKGMFKQPSGALIYPYITPGSASYASDLWDWDSWWSNVALRQILSDIGTAADKNEAIAYEQGCILNYLHYTGYDGYMPMLIAAKSDPAKIKPRDIYKTNMHKPVLAQHAAFLVKRQNGNAEWLRENFGLLQAFITNYQSHHKHKPTGLYYWQNDLAIGVDNDPSTFFRPPGSSASIYLNCLMFKELQAMSYLAVCLRLPAIAKEYDLAAEELKAAIQKNCWDERDGFFYSVDINLLPVSEEPSEIFGMQMVLHSGFPRAYDCLIQRLGVWSGFMAMWAGIATPEQAKGMVEEHAKNEKTFAAPFGIRTLSKMEKMYSVRASNNPSNWLGPIWGISNYMVYKGLVNYGYQKEAGELAAKTIRLFSRDLEKNGALHEYYEPDTGEPILNKGFQNWNYLVTNMIAWMEKREVVEEF